WVRIFAGRIVAVTHGPHFFDKVGRVSAHRPLVTVGADLAFDIEIVEQDKLAGNTVEIGSSFLREEAKRRVSVTFRHVAQHLVVGAVFLDDIETVFDWGMFAGALRDGMIQWSRSGTERSRVQRAAAVGLGGVHGELLFDPVASGKVDEAQGSPEK